MKIIIFDVNNAACSIIASPSGYAMMVDCGSHSEKKCPIDQIRTLKKWLGIKSYRTQNGFIYPLALLHITHPDDDHVKNAKKVKQKFEPYLLHKRDYEEFPTNESIHGEYKEYINKKYRGNNPEKVLWGFDIHKTFKIPMDVVKKDEKLSEKIKNNSSILRYFEFKGIKVLYGGDLEFAGWEWLANNDKGFVETMKKGLDILIAPHHGHKSGFPSTLFDLTGNVKISILSKASEFDKDTSDVSSQYLQYSDGIKYKNLSDKCIYEAKGILTTRSNGNIYLSVDNEEDITFWADKASSNHNKV